MNKRIISSILAIIISLFTLSACKDNSIPADKPTIVEPATNYQENAEAYETEDTAVIDDSETEEASLSQSQKNSIAMLNYLAYLSQEINSSKNSRLYLEEAYASLINNTGPEKVNELTQSHLSSLLDIIEKYRMVNVKRERLQYLYDQNKAKAIREAIPNPIALLSATNARSLKSLAISALYMAVDSVNSYKSYNDELDSEFLQDGWALDDEEAANLHDSRKRAFTYMLEIVREESLPEELTLNEKAIEDFVKWKNNENNTQRLHFFESERATYSSFGNYWLILAECYYEKGDYNKCIEAINEYEKLQIDIFRKDYYLAQSMPNAIVAASEIYSEKDYVPIAKKYLKIIIDNTENTEWSLRTFAAQIYMDLYSKTADKTFLKEAYDITLSNINHLIGEQVELNNKYVKDVEEIKLDDDATKQEKKQIKAYNKELKEKRKKELPVVYEPLRINCEMLFAIAKELNISQNEQNKIKEILYSTDIDIFMNEQIENLFSFNPKNFSPEAKFDKDKIIIPVKYVSESSVISVVVDDGKNKSAFTDWQVDKVDRPSDEFDTYKATYSSNAIKKQKWSDNTIIEIKIYDSENSDNKPLTLKFKAKESKVLGLIKTIDFEQEK